MNGLLSVCLWLLTSCITICAVLVISCGSFALIKILARKANEDRNTIRPTLAQLEGLRNELRGRCDDIERAATDRRRQVDTRDEKHWVLINENQNRLDNHADLLLKAGERISEIGARVAELENDDPETASMAGDQVLNEKIATLSKSLLKLADKVDEIRVRVNEISKMDPRGRDFEPLPTRGI